MIYYIKFKQRFDKGILSYNDILLVDPVDTIPVGGELDHFDGYSYYKDIYRGIYHMYINSEHPGLVPPLVKILNGVDWVPSL